MKQLLFLATLMTVLLSTEAQQVKYTINGISSERDMSLDETIAVQNDIEIVDGYTIGEVKDLPILPYNFSKEEVFGGSLGDPYRWTHACIPVIPGEVFYIKGDIVRAAYTNSDECEHNGHVPIVEGTKIMSYRTKDKYYKFTIPEGCTHFIFCYGPSYNVRCYKPDSVTNIIKREAEFKRISNNIEEIAGVSILKPHFTSNPLLAKATDIREMPENGIYVYSKENKTYTPVFYKKDNNGEFVVIESAEDYSYYDHMSYEHRATYFPYKEGIYYALKPGEGTRDGDIFVTYGKVNKSGGRIPNCSFIDVRQNSLNGRTEPLLYFGNCEDTTLSNYDFYGSILRLEDVDKIVAAPQWSLIYRIYEMDDTNKEIKFVEEKCAAADLNKMNDGIAGFSVLDLSDYNYQEYNTSHKGFILLAFRYSVYEIRKGLRSLPIGMLNLFTDMQSAVYVQWKNDVTVTYDSGIPSKVKNNIDVIVNNTFAPDLMATVKGEDGGYSCWARDGKGDKTFLPIPAMGKTNGWWYCGSNEYNVPHMHVNPISYITASKNRHSRVYVAKGPHSGTSGAALCNNLYGSVCSSTAGLLLGLPAGFDAVDLVSRFQSDFDYRDFDSIDDLMPGDLHARVIDHGGGYHIIYIAEKVIINGEVFCVNAFENNEPYLEWNYYINHDAHIDYVCRTPVGRSVNLLNYKSAKMLYPSVTTDPKTGITTKRYAGIGRPKEEIIKTIDEAYGPYDIQDYPVTEIMCDRGTDAVYCQGEYLGLTVTDNSIKSIRLVKNGDTEKPILYDLTNSRTINTWSDGKVYDICDVFPDKNVDYHGYYEIYVGDVKKESFYIAKPHRICDPYLRFIKDHGDPVVVEQLPDPESAANNQVFRIMDDGVNPDLNNVVENYTYMDADQSDTDTYYDYMLVNGEFVKIKWHGENPRETNVYIDIYYNTIVEFDSDEDIDGKLDEVRSFSVSYRFRAAKSETDYFFIDPINRHLHYYKVDKMLDADNKCHLVVPSRIKLYDGLERVLVTAILLRRTPYGTYRIRLNTLNNSQVQRAGGENQ